MLPLSDGDSFVETLVSVWAASLPCCRDRFCARQRLINSVYTFTPLPLMRHFPDGNSEINHKEVILLKCVNIQ